MNGSIPSCDVYIMIYAYFTVGLLFGLALLIYCCTTLYMNRIIARALAVQGMDGSKGRYAYIELLREMYKKVGKSLPLSSPTQYLHTCFHFVFTHFSYIFRTSVVVTHPSATLPPLSHFNFATAVNTTSTHPLRRPKKIALQ